MTIPADIDPDIAAHVESIRDRFGVDGLRIASRLIEIEIAAFADTYNDLPHD